MKFITIIIFILLVINICASLKSELVLDYFSDLRIIQHVVIFNCYNYESEILKLHKKFSMKNIFTNIVSDFKNASVTEILNRNIIAKCGVVVDCTCSACYDILLEASDHNYYNQSYDWLIFIENSINIVFHTIPNIGINAEITLVEKRNENIYTLTDVYSKGRHLNQSLIFQHYANWTMTNRLTVFHAFPPKYSLSYRGNMTGIILRGVVVIDRPNIEHSQVYQLLTTTYASRGISNIAKYHYAMNLILRSIYKFNIKYRITRGWAGRLENGYRLGLLGVVQRGEVDIAASGAFKRMNRHDEFDNIHEGYIFDSGFVYRLTPEISKSAIGGNFLAPFKNVVWISILGTSIVMCFVLFVVGNTRQYLLENPKISLMLSIIQIIAAFCQQGLDPVPASNPIRVTIIFLILASTILYNYYTSSVVGCLLSSVPMGPTSLNDMLQSSLVLSFLDIGYHKVLFHETNDTIIQMIYNKKVIAPRLLENPPAFTSTEIIVPFLKKGGYAFHSELNLVWPNFANAFDANEICELRVVRGLFQDLPTLMMIQPKRSPYSEMFKIGLLRAKEAGFIKHTIDLYQPKKPICQSQSQVHPVAINGVQSAFQVLGIGAALSIIILTIELLIHKNRKQSDGIVWVE